jgi:hypothetical protein
MQQGVVLKAEAGTGSFVDVGLDRTALVEGSLLTVNARVTLRLGESARVKFVESYGESMLLGEVRRAMRRRARSLQALGGQESVRGRFALRLGACRAAPLLSSAWCCACVLDAAPT